MCGNIGLIISFNSGGLVSVRIVSASPDGGGSTAFDVPLMPTHEILHAMIAADRGVLAIETPRSPTANPNPKLGRMRLVVRKRVPLADDLTSAYLASCPQGDTRHAHSLSVIAHTRFATSSVNMISKLHPHDWHHSGYASDATNAIGGVQWELGETIYSWDAHTRTFVHRRAHVALHGAKIDYWDTLAGLLSLLRVHGRWAAAARLAWLRIVCTKADDASASSAPLGHLAHTTWERWCHFFVEVWEAAHAYKVVASLAGDESCYVISLSGVRELENDPCSRLADPELRGRLQAGARMWPKGLTKGFVHSAVYGFLRVDMYHALIEAMTRGHGSFGVQAHCSLEAGVVVISAKGQAMHVAYSQERPLVLFGSEAAAIGVGVTVDGAPLELTLALARIGPAAVLFDGAYTFLHSRDGKRRRKAAAALIAQSLSRSPSSLTPAALPPGGGGPRTSSFVAVQRLQHPLAYRDVVSGAPALSVLQLTDGLQLRAYSLVHHAEGAMRSPSAFARPSPKPRRVLDLVATDLAETPAALRAVEESWGVRRELYAHPMPRNEASEPHSNLAPAHALAQHLLPLMQQRMVQRLERPDLLIAGVESSLWVAEQFASDLRSLFRYLLVKCTSSNKLFGVGRNSPRKTFLSGSQPLSVATSNEAPRCCPFVSCAGTRPAEPSSLAVVVMQHTLTHLLVHLAVHTREHGSPKALWQSWEPELPTEMGLNISTLFDVRFGKVNVEEEPLVRLSAGCLCDLQHMLATTVPNCEVIAGAHATDGGPLPSPTHDALVVQGVHWGRHVREPWIVLCLVGAYILLTVLLGCPFAWGLVHVALLCAGTYDSVDLSWSAARHLDFPAGQHSGWQALGFGARLMNGIIFVFLPKGITWALRFAEGRPLWGRMGKRTLVIVETPVNHQAYSFCALEVHGASGVGRPDGRLYCMAKTEASLLLACKQAVFIQNPQYNQRANSGNAPEVISVGHNPGKSVASVHVARFVDEVLYNRLVKLRARVSPTEVLLRAVGSVEAWAANGKRLPRASVESVTSALVMTIDRTGYTSLPAGAHFVAAADEEKLTNVGTGNALLKAGLQIKLKARLNRVRSSQNVLDDGGLSGAESVEPHECISFVDKLDTTTQEVRRTRASYQGGTLTPHPHFNPGPDSNPSSPPPPRRLQILDRQIHLQRFYECRLASLERYLAFCVTFHALAKLSSTPWLCKGWDMARSQSNLRVATTAAPISASDAQADGNANMSVVLVADSIASRWQRFDDSLLGGGLAVGSVPQA
ncbi:hypothetical protein T492DRAFT_1120330 [Pavlovales sp. CCMP2436]|nr:hypothetical protein T492DRAFT_1120330 [Pavlovales sp. CCMP2436]